MTSGKKTQANAALAASAPNLRKWLTKLTASVMKHVADLDAEMKLPSTADRGQRIAALTNQLEMVNDSARYFGLNIDFRTDRKRAGAVKQRRRE